MPAPPEPPRFADTRWSLVAALRNAGDERQSQASLYELCLRNWYPVYSYLRRCGHAPELAQQLTREFFDQLLRDGVARAADTGFGRFREFLLAQLQAFLSQERTQQLVTSPVAPLTIEQLEARQRNDNMRPGSPEQALRRGFAVEIIGSGLRRIRAEAREAGRLTMFEALERFLTTEPLPGEFDAVAVELGVRPLFLVMAVKRLRQRFCELVDEELGDTVLNSDELATERSALHEALASDVS